MELCAFTKVHLLPGESKTVTLSIGPRSMRTLDPHFQWHVEPGDFEVILAYHAEDPIMNCRFTVV